MNQKLDVVSASLALAMLLLVSCSGGGDSTYGPPEAPGAVEPAPQPQSVNGRSPDEAESAQQGMPQQQEMPQEGIPPNDAGGAPDQEGASQQGSPPAVERGPQAATRPNAVPHCPSASLPGTYTTIVAKGRLAGTTFTAASGSSASSWQRQLYVVATSSPSPKLTKNPKPAAQSLTVYNGTYTVRNAKGLIDTVGCAELLVTQSGGNVKALTPSFSKPSRVKQLVASGPIIKLTITGLSKSGGSGTFVLSNKFTGTIKLTSRSIVP